jgi:hypothetical protein
MGHGRIDRPDELDRRLGILLALFRTLTANEQAGWRFAHSYVSSAKNLNDNILALVDQVFDPFVRDLRRKISRAF